jgi:hypothetical protein
MPAHFNIICTQVVMISLEIISLKPPETPYTVLVGVPSPLSLVAISPKLHIYSSSAETSKSNRHKSSLNGKRYV